MDNQPHHIADTAFWVAVFRADEDERPDAVFHDPFARRLAGDRGKRMADNIMFSRKNSWAFVARTFLFDQFVLERVEAGIDTVVNLAAGLDTRAYRLALPPHLHWIEVDLPEIIAYKKDLLSNEKPACRLESISFDLSQRNKRVELFSEMGSRSKKVLLMSEGLMIYLSSPEAGELAEDLSAIASFRYWVSDLVSPAVLAMSQKEMGPALKSQHLELKFAPEEGEEFFQARGWKWLESRSRFQTAARLNRLPSELQQYAGLPEPEGPVRDFTWAGVCLFENKNADSISFPVQSKKK
jgi:methyltransferase (TIGR00027 family)